MKLNMYFIDTRISTIDFYEKLGFEVVSEVFTSKKTGSPM